jgi:hypothetical protein
LKLGPMIFQTLDDKDECVGIYTDNALIFDAAKFPTTLSRTWSYAPYLQNYDVEYANLYLEGEPLGSILPEYLRDDWEEVFSRLQAFKRSLSTAQVDLSETCFYDLVPTRFLIDLCEVKNKITEHIFQNIPRPARYEFYKKMGMLLEEISHQPIRIDKRIISSYATTPKYHNQCTNLLECAPYVTYDLFGTKTGRLTTTKASFPILTLNRSFRDAILPHHDYYIELDFNGAEIRTLLGLLGRPQPPEDVHQFHLDTVFPDGTTREQAKTIFFAWLYGSRTAASPEVMKKLEDYYQKDEILNEYWDGSHIRTPYHKVIENTSAHHALNYLVQSTAADLSLLQFLKVNELLKTQGSGSRIAFLIHDAVVLDFKKEDEHLINSIVQLMSSTRFGNFKINIKRGKSLGKMRSTENG